MMSIKQLFTLLFCTALTALTSGQEFQTLNPDESYFYIDTDETVYSLRIDSTDQEDDYKTLYPFAIIQDTAQEYPWCLTFDEASWVGPKIILKEDGTDIYFNKDNDSLKIKTFATTGDEWNFYTSEDMIVKASVTNEGDTSMLEQTTPFKEISLQAYDHEMNSINHAVNSLTLVLTEAFGLSRIINFYSFPDHTSSMFNHDTRNFELGGIASAETGIENLTWKKVHDFQPGDEFHIRSKSSFSTHGGFMSTQTTKLTYLDREESGDTITYTVARQKESTYEDYQDGSTTYSYEEDTINMTIEPNPSFDKLSFEYGDDYYYFTQFYDGNKSQKIKNLYEYMTNPYDDETCLEPGHHDGCIDDGYYIEGLGGPYYDCHINDNRSSRELLYFNKADSTYGEPVVLNTTEKVNHESQATIYPNPAEHAINIKGDAMDFPLTVDFINHSGTKVLTLEVPQPDAKVDIDGLAPGLYLYHIKNDKKLLSSDKLIVN